MRYTIMALLALSVGCGGETVTVAEPQDDTDTVTLAQAMASTGTEDAGLFGHSVGRAAPGIPPFDPDIPGDVWDAVEADVRQHVFWHTDDRFTVHALSAGREKITSGPRLDDPVVYEDPEPVDVARAVGSLDAFRVGGGRAPAPNQSFLAKQMQTRIAACISTVVQELSNRARVSPVPWQVPDNVLWQPIGWRIGNQHFDYRPVPGQDRASGPYASITFSNARWDPSYSKVNYGTKTIAQDVRVSDTGKTKLIQNDSDGYVGVSYTESEAITNAFSSTVTHGMTLDMTASSTTTVGGEYAGVSAEQSITLEFGVSTTDEESQEKSEEGTSEAAIDIDFDAEPNQYYLVTITKENKTSYQPFSIDGVMDFDITIRMPGADGARLERHFPGQRVSVQGLQGFDQFVHGFDTSYPTMRGFYDAAQSRTKTCIQYVLNPEHRRISVSGTNQAALESNADYHVENLGTELPDHLAHLPVVDANDVDANDLLQ